MDIYVKRVGDGLFPDGTESAVEFSRLPFGKPLHCEVKQPRNAAHHRLFFALAHRIAEAKGIPAETVVDLFKICSGHCEIIRSKKYGDLRLPKSISFAKMDQTAFSLFFEQCVAIAYSEWGIPPEAVADLLCPQEAHITRAA